MKMIAEPRELDKGRQRTDRLKEIAEETLPGEEVKVVRRGPIDKICVGAAITIYNPLGLNEVNVNNPRYEDAAYELARAFGKAERKFGIGPRWSVEKRYS